MREKLLSPPRLRGRIGRPDFFRLGCGGFCLSWNRFTISTFCLEKIYHSKCLM